MLAKYLMGILNDRLFYREDSSWGGSDEIHYLMLALLLIRLTQWGWMSSWPTHLLSALQMVQANGQAAIIPSNISEADSAYPDKSEGSACCCNVPLRPCRLSISGILWMNSMTSCWSSDASAKAPMIASRTSATALLFTLLLCRKVVPTDQSQLGIQ